MMRQAVKAASALLGVMLAVLLLPAAASAPVFAAPRGARLTATVDGKPVGASTEARPIRLSPRRQATLSVEVINEGSELLDVRTVRLEGKVVGLSFFAYDTAVGLRVAPGQTGSRRFLLDLGGLDGQATGLIPGAVKLLDADRKVVAEEGGVIDVRGSMRSVYGVFGVGVAFLTAVSFLGALVGLARHRLPPNRWRRALRFLTPGLGLGLLLNFTLSATRVFVPTPGRWLTIVVVSAAVLFGLGYLTPAPDTGEDEDDDEDERVALPAPPAQTELPAPPAQTELPAPPAQTELPAPPAELELAAPPPWPELATPEGMEALPAGPAGEAPELGDPVAGERPAPVVEVPVPPARSELATPDGSEAVPAPDPVPDPANPEGPGPRPAPPTVAVPTAGPVEP